MVVYYITVVRIALRGLSLLLFQLHEGNGFRVLRDYWAHGFVGVDPGSSEAAADSIIGVCQHVVFKRPAPPSRGLGCNPVPKSRR